MVVTNITPPENCDGAKKAAMARRGGQLLVLSRRDQQDALLYAAVTLLDENNRFVEGNLLVGFYPKVGHQWERRFELNRKLPCMTGYFGELNTVSFKVPDPKPGEKLALLKLRWG
jgi:hypothetical protein